MESSARFIDETIDRSQVDQLSATYGPQHLLVIEDFLPRDFVNEHFVPEVESCAKFIHRVKVPRFKKSGSVSQYHLKKNAPQLYQLYHSEKFKGFIESIVDESLTTCPDSDPHAVALYNYTEPGDHIGVHYDKSFYKGRRYTVLLGMIQNSTASKLVCYPGATKSNRRKNPVEVFTHPGTLVVFNGDILWHEVTPLAKNERRVILTMEYLTDARISKFWKAISNFKDRYLYFGKTPKDTHL